jgi:putative oxidoreductase
MDWRGVPFGARAPQATILIRLMTGSVFLSQGIQKFLHPLQLGVDRFTKSAIPAPEFSAPFAGVREILAGLLLLWGLPTRAAALLMIVNMTVVILPTRLPILLEKGFRERAHESRTARLSLLAAFRRRPLVARREALFQVPAP